MAKSKKQSKEKRDGRNGRDEKNVAELGGEGAQKQKRGQKYFPENRLGGE